MNFVLEIMIMPNGAPGCLVNTIADENSAQSKYHDILKSAAISSNPVHGAIILSEALNSIDKKVYTHPAPPPPPEVEPVEEEPIAEEQSEEGDSDG